MPDYTCPECGTTNPTLTLGLDHTMYHSVTVTESGAFEPSDCGQLEANHEAVRMGDSGDERIFCECGYYLPDFELTWDERPITPAVKLDPFTHTNKG